MATKITKRVVDSKPPGEKDIFVWDSELPGFGLKITPAGRKVYVAQSRVGGKTVRVTIGPLRQHRQSPPGAQLFRVHH